MTSDLLFLAWRSLRASPWRSLTLVLGTSVALFLPLFTASTATMIERGLLERAEDSPILLGVPGSEFDLSMASLYFRTNVPNPISYGLLGEAQRFGTAIPLTLGHSAGGVPLVGTSIDYFRSRRLRLATGRLPALLGEAVAGASIGKQNGLEVGTVVRSDLGSLYDLSGAYPMLLRIVGILQPAGNADDHALFTDTRTIWMLEGRVHGHSNLDPASVVADPDDDEGGAASRENDNLEATAALFLFSEVDERTLQSFHLHGDEAQAPISSILVFPTDQRNHDQLLGDTALRNDLQAVRPTAVVDEILGIALHLRRGALAYFVIVAISTATFYFLALFLAVRLRADELDLIQRIGGSRRTIAGLLAIESGIILAGALGLAAGLAAIARLVVGSALGL